MLGLLLLLVNVHGPRNNDSLCEHTDAWCLLCTMLGGRIGCGFVSAFMSILMLSCCYIQDNSRRLNSPLSIITPPLISRLPLNNLAKYTEIISKNILLLLKA